MCIRDRALSSGLFGTCHLSEHKQFSSMPNDGNTVTYSNNELQQASENTFDFMNKDAKMAPVLPSPSAEKKLQVGDSSVGVSRPSKAGQRNLPKLIIPTKETIERCGKGTTYSGSTTTPKSNCCTKASGELNPTTKSYKLLGEVSANRNDAVKDAIDVWMGSGNVNESEMETFSSPSQENKDGLGLTGMNSETQHASEDSSHHDDRANHQGNKSDWIAFKMERLRRKKRQIEQVIMISY